MALDELEKRKSARSNMAFEARQVVALEQIADSLFTVQTDLADMRATLRNLVLTLGRSMATANAKHRG